MPFRHCREGICNCKIKRKTRKTKRRKPNPAIKAAKRRLKRK